jgi:hypothetical protein
MDSIKCSPQDWQGHNKRHLLAETFRPLRFGNSILVIRDSASEIPTDPPVGPYGNIRPTSGRII